MSSQYESITVGDLGVQLAALILGDDGSAKDISTATDLEIRLQPPRGATRVFTASFVTDGTDGELAYTTASVSDLDIPGFWQVEGKVWIPADGPFRSEVRGFYVKPELGGSYPFADLSILEAVNLMLSGLGEQPVDSFVGSLNPEVVTAVRILEDCDRALQLVGYGFNTEVDVELEPDGNDEIVLDSDVIAVKPYYESDAYAIRSGKLWDRCENRFTFSGNQRVTLVRALPFGDLPLHARDLIKAAATRSFVERMEGRANPGMREDERMARAKFLHQEAESSDIRVGRRYPMAGVTNFRSPARRRFR